MRHAARHEGAGTGAADRDLFADLEGDLAAQDIGHLVAVAMQVEGAPCPGWNGLLEHHDAAAGLAAPQLECERSAWRCRALSRRYSDVGRAHRSFLLSSGEIGTRSTVMAIAHAGLRSTVRGSSTSSSMVSPGKGVAAIWVKPSDERNRCHAPCGMTAIVPARSAKDLGGPSSHTISRVAVPPRMWTSSSPVRWRSQWSV